MKSRSGHTYYFVNPERPTHTILIALKNAIVIRLGTYSVRYGKPRNQ